MNKQWIWIGLGLMLSANVQARTYYLDNPCIGTHPENGISPEKMFGAQSTSILPVNGKKGAFIAMFDLWRPDNAVDGRYIWLPIDFDGDCFSIPWNIHWKLSVFN